MYSADFLALTSRIIITFCNLDESYLSLDGSANKGKLRGNLEVTYVAIFWQFLSFKPRTSMYLLYDAFDRKIH